MNTKVIRHGDMFDRVIVFGQGCAGDFAAGSAGATRFATLGNVKQQLVAAGALQQGISDAARNALMLTLEATLQNIARTAGAIAQDEPGFNDPFPPPEHYNPGEVRATAQQYLAQLAAGETDDDATKAAKAARAAKFIAHEMPATFVADLQAAAGGIADAEGEHEDSRETGVGNTALIAKLVRDGMKEVNYLDAIVRNKYGGNVEKLRAWETASRIERAPVHAKPAPAPAPAVK